MSREKPPAETPTQLRWLVYVCPHCLKDNIDVHGPRTLTCGNCTSFVSVPEIQSMNPWPNVPRWWRPATHEESGKAEAGLRILVLERQIKALREIIGPNFRPVV